MKITLRLWLYITFIVVIVLALIWYFQIVLLPDSYYNSSVAEIDSYANVILQYWEGSRGSITPDAEAELEKLVMTNGLHASVYLSDCEVIFKTGWELEPSRFTSADIRNVLKGQYITRDYSRPGYGQALLIAKPVYMYRETYDHVGISAVLVVAAPIAPVENMQLLLVEQLLIITIFSFIIALSIAFMVSGQFVKPIRVAERAAHEIAKGNLSARINSQDKSEIGDLSRTIDNMAEKLAQIENMRRDFIANVSHQFKTPLSIIQGHTELIYDMLPEEQEKEIEQSYNVILREIQRLDKMSKDILQLSELTSGLAGPTFCEVELYPFCVEICKSLEILNSNIKLKCNISSSLTVNFDPVQMDHVFRNIIQNAIKHSECTNLSVAAEDKPDSVLVRICDDGMGMPEATVQKLWIRFFKGNQKDRTGSGLGMAIVAAVLDAHGYKYGVKSPTDYYGTPCGTEIWFEIRKT